MKKLIIILVIMIGSLNYCNAQTKDFRGFSWGETMEKVKLEEKSKYLSTINNRELLYSDSIGGSDFRVLYIFNDNNKLESGIYIFAKKYSNPQLYFHDYTIYVKLLTQKYGKPAKIKETWSLNTAVYDKDNQGQAIAEGNLSLYTAWFTERTVIKITLINIENHPSLQIHYTTQSLDELDNKENLMDALSKL